MQTPKAIRSIQTYLFSRPIKEGQQGEFGGTQNKGRQVEIGHGRYPILWLGRLLWFVDLFFA